MGRFARRYRDRPVINEEVQTEAPCSISWRPNALAPVMAGNRAYGPTDGSGAPVPLEVWFPAIHGNPPTAPILPRCGPYPLVVFAHGGCYVTGAGPEPQRLIYRAWSQSRMIQQQARAGYVVVVPQLGGVAPGSDDDLVKLRQVVQWMRSEWVHAGLLAPQTAVVGHSRGGVHGARLVAEGGIRAYVALSAEYHAWFPLDVAIDALASISRPKLFILGSFDDQNALDDSWRLRFDGSPRPPGTWNRLKPRKHEAYVRDMGHYDYLLANEAGCSGDNAFAAELASDLVTMFLGRYLPPPSVPDLATRIPALLYLPAWGATLRPEQAFFSASYLTSFAALSSASPNRRVALSYALTPGAEVSAVLPS